MLFDIILHLPPEGISVAACLNDGLVTVNVDEIDYLIMR